MKKVGIILSILLIVILITKVIIKNYGNTPKKLPNGTVVFNLFKYRQASASKILYEYVLNELSKLHDDDYINNPQKAKELYDLTTKNVWAFEYDLNDDGVNEVIGFPGIGFYNCAQGYSLFILQKTDDKYYKIFDKNYSFFIEPIFNLYVLRNKTNGYNDILFYGSFLYDFPPRTIKYGKNGYIYSKFLK